MVRESGSAGAALIEHGPGDDTLVTDGETFMTQLGPQGLYMFVVRARVSGLAIEDGDTGAVYGSAIDATGTTISADFGCAEHEFAAMDDGSMHMTGPLIIAIFPNYTSDLMGGMVTLDVTVRDAKGQTASTTSVVKATMPPASRFAGPHEPTTRR